MDHDENPEASPFRPPLQEPERLGVLDLVLLSLIGLGAASLAVIHVAVAPAFGRMFHDFAAELPLITRLVLGPWFLPVAAVFTVALGASGAICRARGSAALGSTLLGAGIAVALGTAAFSLYALYAPIFDLAGNIAA